MKCSNLIDFGFLKILESKNLHFLLFENFQSQKTFGSIFSSKPLKEWAVFMMSGFYQITNKELTFIEGYFNCLKRFWVLQLDMRIDSLKLF